MKRKEKTRVKGYFRNGRMVRGHRRTLEKEVEDLRKERQLNRVLAAGGLGVGALGLGVAALRGRGLLSKLSKKGAAEAMPNNLPSLDKAMSKLRTLRNKAGADATVAREKAPAPDLEALGRKVEGAKQRAKDLKSIDDSKLDNLEKAFQNRDVSVADDSSLQESLSRLKNLRDKGRTSAGATAATEAATPDLEALSKKVKGTRQKAKNLKTIDDSRLDNLKDNIRISSPKSTASSGDRKGVIAQLEDDILQKISKPTKKAKSKLVNEERFTRKVSSWDLDKIQEHYERRVDIGKAIDNLLESNKKNKILSGAELKRLEQFKRKNNQVTAILGSAESEKRLFSKIKDTIGNAGTSKYQLEQQALRAASTKKKNELFQQKLLSLGDVTEESLKGKDLDRLPEDIRDKIARRYFDSVDEGKRTTTNPRDFSNNAINQLEEYLRSKGILKAKVDNTKRYDASMLEDFSRSFGDEIYFASDVVNTVANFSSSFSMSNKATYFPGDVAEFGLFGIKKPEQDRSDYNKELLGTAAALGGLYLAYRKYGKESNKKKPKPTKVISNNTSSTINKNVKGIKTKNTGKVQQSQGQVPGLQKQKRKTVTIQGN